MHPVGLEVRQVVCYRGSKAVQTATGVGRAEGIRGMLPIVLAKDGVILAGYPVYARGPLVPCEQVSIGLRAKQRNVVLEERDVPVNRPRLDTRGHVAWGG